MPQPSIPPRRLSSGRRPSAAPDPTLAHELAELRAAVASLQAELRPLPERVAGLAKISDAQRKRVDAVAAAQERAENMLIRQDGGLGARPDAGLKRLTARLRGLLPRGTRPPQPTGEAAAEAAAGLPAVDWVLAGGRVAPEARAVLVALFGLEAQAREIVVQRLTASMGGADPAIVPVFVTESTDFAPMRRAGAAFEHLPLHGGDRPGAPRRDWQLYLTRRFAGLCLKWQPVRVVAFGPAAAGQLAAWRASPQLPDPVRDLLAVTDEPLPDPQASSKKSTAPSSRS